ncbi:hypothetical protein [Embleya sp. AB8]|uniref:hypothetical protein n=1 Tax=Embleya sp. AB8 TaxID=3156304 RepID=UPI003C7691AA
MPDGLPHRLTGTRQLVEDTTTDHYWGRGTTGTGKNMLGPILMRTGSRSASEPGRAGD